MRVIGGEENYRALCKMNDTELTRRSCGGWNGILYIEFASVFCNS
jgi:hypothetical protein